MTKVLWTNGTTSGTVNDQRSNQRRQKYTSDEFANEEHERAIIDVVIFNIMDCDTMATLHFKQTNHNYDAKQLIQE